MNGAETEREILEGLNDVQRLGVLHGDGPLLILAGAGSGKTRVLTRRLAHLVGIRHVPPERILAVTFTNKAAGEMKERVAALLGEGSRALWIGTFHSICLRILKRHQDRLGFTRPLTVFDADDSLALIRTVIRDLGLLPECGRPRDVQGAISSAKNRMLDPERLAAASPLPGKRTIARVWSEYAARLQDQGGLDFDDLLLRALHLLEGDREIRERYARQFRHTLVDEYQDTNRIQFRLVRALASVHDNVAVVGDDDQSIYGWRGADITNILEFERQFPGAVVLRLEQNYRSTSTILDIAHAVVRHNQARMEKRLWTQSGAGEPVRLFIGEDEEDEARQIVRWISRLVGQGLPSGACAVLYRTHAQSRPLEEALLRGQIAYQVVGGISFYQRREVKDLLAYLRLLHNPFDEVSFRRAMMAPRRGVGEGTCDRLIQEARSRGVDFLAACHAAPSWGIRGRGAAAILAMHDLMADLRLLAAGPVHRLLEEVVRRTEYEAWLRAEGALDWEDRAAHLVELVEGARNYEASEEGTTLADFLEQVSLYAQADDLREGSDRVTLMTVHNAKGLEFDSVFVTGLEDGLFPHHSSFADPPELEEERRLFYVAVTRARSRLHLSASRSRRRINPAAAGGLSRFLGDLPEDLLEVVGWDRPIASIAERRLPLRGGERPQDRRRGGRSALLSSPSQDEAVIQREPLREVSARGRLARHVRYGVGEVLAVEGEGEQARLEIRFPGWGIKKILRSYLTFPEEP